MGSPIATQRTRISAIGQERTNSERGNKTPTAATHPGTQGMTPAGGGGFPEWKPARRAHQGLWRQRVLLIVDGRRAITREVCVSHGCNAFLVEKGNGVDRIRTKNMYIDRINHYLWRGEDPTGQLKHMGGGRTVAGNPDPVWEPGFRPGRRVLPVTRVNITPEELPTPHETTGSQVYQAKINKCDHHSCILLQVGPSLIDMDGEYRGGGVVEEVEGNEGGDASIE